MHCQTQVSSKQSSPPSAITRRDRAAEGGWQSRLLRLAPLAGALLPLALAQVAIAADQTEKLTKALSYKPRQADVNFELVPADAARRMSGALASMRTR